MAVNSSTTQAPSTTSSSAALTSISTVAATTTTSGIPTSAIRPLSSSQQASAQSQPRPLQAPQSQPRPPQAQAQSQPRPPQAQAQLQPRPPEAQAQSQPRPPQAQGQSQSRPPQAQAQSQPRPPQSQAQPQPRPSQSQPQSLPRPSQSQSQPQPRPSQSQPQSQPRPSQPQSQLRPSQSQQPIPAQTQAQSQQRPPQAQAQQPRPPQSQSQSQPRPHQSQAQSQPRPPQALAQSQPRPPQALAQSQPRPSQAQGQSQPRPPQAQAQSQPRPPQAQAQAQSQPKPPPTQPQSQPRPPNPPPTSQNLQSQQQSHRPILSSQHHQTQYTAAQAHQTVPSRPQLVAPKLHQEPIRYPVATSGRGFVSPKPVTGSSINTTSARPLQLHEQTMATANPGIYPPRPIVPYLPYPQVHPTGNTPSFSSSQHQNALLHLIRPSNLHSPQANVVSAAPSARVIHGSAHSHPKIGVSSGSIPDSNGPKEHGDRAKDDVFLTISDRKVRISDDGSLYALCRSWLRNGYPGDQQPQCADLPRSLPKPLPVPVLDANSPGRKEADDQDNMDEDEKSIDNLRPEELLQGHIKRAKKVRARLRKERLQRIARYKSRLALLLPPIVEQCRNDTSAGTA